MGKHQPMGKPWENIMFFSVTAKKVKIWGAENYLSVSLVNQHPRLLGGAMVEKLHSLHALSGLPSASYHVLLETKNTIQPTTPWLCKMIKRAIWNLGWFIVSNVQLSARGFILFSSPVHTHLRLLLYYLCFPSWGDPQNTHVQWEYPDFPSKSSHVLWWSPSWEKPLPCFPHFPTSTFSACSWK